TILDGPYPNNVDAQLISPQFTIPPASYNPYLSFWHWFSTSSSDDNGRVQITTNGNSWFDISPAFSGAGGSWRNATTNLVAYAGQSVRIALRFVSDQFSGAAGGWYVDDIQLASSALLPPVIAVQPQ